MAADDPWTPARVEAALRAALVTLRRLPSKHLFPAGLKIAWPELVREWDSYGWDKATKPRMQATAQDIQDMDRALGWIWNWLHPTACRSAGLVEDTGNILLMRAAHLTWEEIGQWRIERWLAPQAARRGGPNAAIPGGNSVPQLRKAHRAGIARIVERLGGDAPPVAEEPREPQREWGVEVEVAPIGEALGEGSYGPIHARARWQMVRRGRR